MNKGNKVFVACILVWCVFMGCFLCFNLQKEKQQIPIIQRPIITQPSVIPSTNTSNSHKPTIAPGTNPQITTPPEISTDPTLSEEELRWQERAEEYPEATRVWLYMTQNFGWTDEICAGIMGNIMAEIGGGTLDFSDWNHDSPYGMFQWLGSRKIELKEIYGDEPTIEEQLEFMYDELYGTDGVTQQVEDWQREKILASTNPKQVAKYFCIWFERPGDSGTIRQTYASRAYQYFTE